MQVLRNVTGGRSFFTFVGGSGCSNAAALAKWVVRASAAFSQIAAGVASGIGRATVPAVAPVPVRLRGGAKEEE